MLLNYFQHLIYIFTIVLMVTYGQRLTAENTQLDRKELFCKCMEYWECFLTGGQLYSYCAFSNEVCCMTNSSLNSITSIQTEKSKNSECGKKEFDSGIEEFSEFGEWSWHIAILVVAKDLYICGGSLIDEKWVLTAAHCVNNYDKPESLKVRVGEYDVSSTTEPEKHEEFIVGQIFIHSKFNNKTLVNDIALLKLQSSVKKKPNINIVCLPETKFTEESFLQKSSKCYITGWGKVAERGDYSFILKEVNVPLWNHTKCEQSLKFHFGSNYNLPKTAICAGNVGQDACDGDGGGGLYCEHNKLWYQIGIISFGIGCGRKNSPGVYTNVKSYLDWIHKIVSEK